MAANAENLVSPVPKRALLVVDVQNDFCPGGALAVPRGDEVVEPLNKLIDKFLERGEPVYKTRDWHPPETKHFVAYGGTWPVHCVQNTEGAEFHPALRDDPRIIVGLGPGTGPVKVRVTWPAGRIEESPIEIDRYTTLVEGRGRTP